MNQVQIQQQDSVSTEEERRSFLVDLLRFHQNKGTQYDSVPKIAGREVDLHHLYKRVIQLGGWQKVCHECSWETLQTEFGIPAACPNGEQCLKFLYVRYLYLYEKVNFLGEDPGQADQETETNPARKKLAGPFYGVPLKYNYNQHKIPDILRKKHGFSCDFVQDGDYEKLEKALLCGLPNEVDFAVNVCTLLSNEGQHVLRLDNSKNLLNLLLAHVGVFNPGYESLHDLYKYGWIIHTKRDFFKFWHQSVSDKDVQESILSDKPGQNVIEKSPDLNLHLGNDNGVHCLEGQRVTQLAVLLRNLSFQNINQKIMASNAAVLNFLILSLFSSYGSLKQLALDTLANLSEQIVLEYLEAHGPKLILDFVTNSFCSGDKFTVVRALETLGKLCQVEENETILTESLKFSTYCDIIQLLTVHDIQLIVHILETLLQLSELGEPIATAISDVSNSVDLLINLLTVEAQSYGPNALTGIKVVEYVPAPSDRKDETLITEPTSEQTVPATVLKKPVAPVPKPQTATPAAPVVIPAQQQSNTTTDMEATTLEWLKATYECRRSGKTTQIDLFSEYLQVCHKYSLSKPIPSTEFLKLVLSAFTPSETKMVTMPNGDKDICFLGIGRRATPKPFQISNMPAQSCNITNTTTSGVTLAIAAPATPTPTLRQRLMEPVRHPQQQTPGAATPNRPIAPRLIAPKPTPNQMTPGKSIVISQIDINVTPSKRLKLAPKPPEITTVIKTPGHDSQRSSNETNLIKCLLARKLNQNMVDKQNGISPNPTVEVIEQAIAEMNQPQQVAIAHSSDSNLSLSQTIQVPITIETQTSNPKTNKPIPVRIVPDQVAKKSKDEEMDCEDGSQIERKNTTEKSSNPFSGINEERKLLNSSSPMLDTDIPTFPICLNNIQSGLSSGISDDSMDSIAEFKLSLNKPDQSPIPETPRNIDSTKKQEISTNQEVKVIESKPVSSTDGAKIVSEHSETKQSVIPKSPLENQQSTPQDEKKVKVKKRQRSLSNPQIVAIENKSPLMTVQVVDFMCEWGGCNRCFENARAVFIHVVKTHVPATSDGICHWLNCKYLKRQRWSLITHLQDHHCSDSALRASSARRMQELTSPSPAVKKMPATPTPTPPVSAPTTETTDSNGTLVYPNDAAMQAIKRFLIRPPYQEFLDNKEGPVTKHIRLTSALILRNIARYSPSGRSLIKKKEQQISYVTMSAVESSTALAGCLWEILNEQ